MQLRLEICFSAFLFCLLMSICYLVFRGSSAADFFFCFWSAWYKRLLFFFFDWFLLEFLHRSFSSVLIVFKLFCKFCCRCSASFCKIYPLFIAEHKFRLILHSIFLVLRLHTYTYCTHSDKSTGTLSIIGEVL